MWHLQANSHGTHDYDLVPPPRPVSQFRIALAWLFDSVRRHWKAFIKPTEPAGISRTAANRNIRRGFTTLGKAENDR